MKKHLSLILAAVLVSSLVSCRTTNNAPDETSGVETSGTETSGFETSDTGTEDIVTGASVASQLQTAFRNAITATPDATAEELACVLAQHSAVSSIAPMVSPVEEGWLNGFEAESITGFSECATFAPMIGTIPFLGYVFVLPEGADVEAFKNTLTSSANLRWNICTAADEMVCESEGNTVLFVMAPTAFEAE